MADATDGEPTTEQDAASGGVADPAPETDESTEPAGADRRDCSPPEPETDLDDEEPRTEAKLARLRLMRVTLELLLALLRLLRAL